MIYAIIKQSNNICQNIILWDGQATWSPPSGCVAALQNGIQIGDECEQVNGVWQKVDEQ